MIFAKFSRYVKAMFASDKDPWALTEAEYEEQLQLSPEIGKAARLASAKHALKTGVHKSVVAAAFPEEVEELRKTSAREIIFAEFVTYRVFSKASSRPFIQPIFKSEVISPARRFAIEILKSERKAPHAVTVFNRVASS